MRRHERGRRPTAASVLASIVSSQNELHAQFGGVVPEVASRRHTELLPTVVAEAMDVAGPGGTTSRRSPRRSARPHRRAAGRLWPRPRRIAYAPPPAVDPRRPPQGHIAANFAARRRAAVRLPGRERRPHAARRGRRRREVPRRRRARWTTPPARPSTRAPACSASAIPGGKELDELAARGEAGYVAFPRAVPRGRDFSFSGLKTALLYDLRERDPAEIEAHRADIAASYQAAIVRQLIDKTMACAAAEGVRRIALAGGVAANSGLRHAVKRAATARDSTLPAAPQPVHRQRRDDRPGGGSPADRAVAGLPRRRRLRKREPAARREGGRPPPGLSQRPSPSIAGTLRATMGRRATT